MNTLEKAINQIKNCSQIIACKTFDEIKSLFDDLSNRGYTWIDNAQLDEVLDDLIDIDRAVYVVIYEDKKLIDDFMELSIFMMKDEDKNLFLDRVTTYKKIKDTQ